MSDAEYTKDFFISHADADVHWAEWIAGELENNGYTVIHKGWDILPGHNLLAKIDEALSTCRHTLHVLSDKHNADIAARTAALNQGLDGKDRALIPIRVSDGDIPPLLETLVTIDLRGAEESEARRRLLAGVAKQVERVARSGFPNKSAKKTRFPGDEPEVFQLRGKRAEPSFIGRDDMLTDLYRALRAGRPTSPIQAIVGLGGLGKTQLAVEYAFRHAAAYDVVWWVRAEDPATLRGDYAELATELDLPFDKDDQAIAALRQTLRRRKNWLLIFDNAEDPDELLPLLPDKTSGHVLITSRRPEWPHAEIKHLEVLPSAAATEYLRQWGGVSSSDTARDLAEALGGLPLALTHAASTIRGMSASEYLDLLHRQSPELFAPGASGNHQATIASTWRVSFDHLAARSPSAVALFRLAAFLGAEAIPIDQILPVPDMPAELAQTLTDPFRRSDATQALGEYSLAKTGDGLMSIHRMVQAVTRAALGAEEPRWAGFALATMSIAFPIEVGDPAFWPACEPLLPHALSSAQHARRLHVDIAEAIDLLERIARYLLARGRLDQAAAVVEDALNSSKELPAEADEYLHCRNTQGLILLNQGDHHGACLAQEEVYQTRIRKRGDSDLDTLRAGRDLVEALFRQGQWMQATELQNQLVDAFTAVLGTEDLETVKAVAYQATLLRTAGHYWQARTLEEQVLEARRRILGGEHPDTLTAIGNLAGTLHAQGEYHRAHALQEQVLEARRRILGNEHPATLTAISILAGTLHVQGEYHRARTLQEQVLEARRRILGNEHPDTLTAISNLAGTLHAQGEYHHARTLQEQALEAKRRILGNEHPDTLTAIGNLAGNLSAQGEHHHARTLQEQALEARRRLLGNEHPDTLTAIGNLAGTLHAQGEYHRAHALQEQVLEARRRLLGDEHPATLTAIGDLAGTLSAQGEHHRAHALREQALEARRRILGNEHPDTLTSLINFAISLHVLGETEKAHGLIVEALAVSKRIHGQRNPLTSHIAWKLVSILDAPHEQIRQKSIIFENFSWLSKEPSNRLSGEQKTIREQLKRFFGKGSKLTNRRKPKGRR
ncbi:tetratricopeptide repeat protein [Streptosporangiaceae bacterium NEAU-GS5]|nr:tetratricopeptide repeat protein [Streptosporangiaceae bacterium NEAU-GS5]